MEFSTVSYTSMQQIPNTDIRFNIVYNRGTIYFHFSLRAVKDFLSDYDTANSIHKNTMATIIRLMATEPHSFSHLGDAETWLRVKYGLVDLQWQLRRVDQVNAVCVRAPQGYHFAILEYPTIGQGAIIVTKDLKACTARITGFSDMAVLTLPIELAVMSFPYDEEDYGV